MITHLAPIGRTRFPSCDGAHLTPVGWKLARLFWRLRRTIPVVSMRRYILAKLERDRLLHDLHMQAIAMNRMERENRTMMRRLSGLSEEEERG